MRSGAKDPRVTEAERKVSAKKQTLASAAEATEILEGEMQMRPI